MYKHHAMSPSKWGGLLACNCYTSGEATEAAERGTELHAQLEKMLVGIEVPDADEGVVWAYNEIMGIATGIDNVHIESKVAYCENGQEIYNGRVDAWLVLQDGLHVIDYKSGREGDISYAAQLAGYALALCRSKQLMVDKVIVHILFGGEQKHIRNEITLDWCADVLAKVKESFNATEKAQTPNEWCKYCGNKGDCAALHGMATGIVKARVAGISDTFWRKVAHPSTINDAETMGQALWAADKVEEWVDSVKHHAKIMNEAGMTPMGYISINKKGDRKIVNVNDALSACGITKDELPIKLTFTDLVEIVGKKNGVPAKKADALVMKKAENGTWLLRGEESKQLRKAKG